MSQRVPILFLSDSPDCPSGLARIGRDLATGVHEHLGDKFEVGYLGRGGVGGRFPFPTWVIPHNLYGMKNTAEWGSSILRDVWREFAGERQGIVFSIWDPARMIWLGQPKYLADSPIRDFLLDPPFKKWGYFPVDGHTPSGGLGLMAAEALQGYDRVLAYTRYGAKVMSRALGSKSDTPCVRSLPHMLSDVWYPRDKAKSREHFLYPPDAFVLGVVATNQQRKDWGLAAAVAAILKKRCASVGREFRQWWHIDQPEKDWSVMELCTEYGLEECTMVTFPPKSDDWLATQYSACDATLAIGAEGFGYPIVESQACGTPVIHGNYAGGAEFVPPENRVEPVMGPLILYSLSNIQRMAYDPLDWANKLIVPNICLQRVRPVGDMKPLWKGNVWPKWEQWFREGLNAL